MKNRKRILKRFKVWALMRILPIPKVRLQVRFRQITNLKNDMTGFSLKAIGYKGNPLSVNPPIAGLYTLDFGNTSFKYLVKKGEYWDENGRVKYKGKISGWHGQGEFYNSMWRYIMRAHIEGRINEMDYAK